MGTAAMPGLSLGTSWQKEAMVRLSVIAVIQRRCYGLACAHSAVSRSGHERAEYCSHACLRPHLMTHIYVVTKAHQDAGLAAAKKEVVEAAEKQEREAREAREKAEREERKRAEKEAESTKQLEESKLSKAEPQDSDSVTSIASEGKQAEAAVEGQNIADQAAAAAKSNTGEGICM